MTTKQFISGMIIVLILSLTITRTNIKQVFGLNNNGTASTPNQTVPTRTPEPGPTNTPAPKPTSSGGGGDKATAVPTSTVQSTATATAAPPVTIAYTPVGGFVSTAEPCGSQPTLKAQNPTNVRQGPGANYPIVDQLVFLEVRFILGRAADAAWWLIQLDDGPTGWVADNIVTVQGYIGGVPIVPAPAVNGQTPTPGTLWNPTPRPFCTVTATATAVSSATPWPTTAVIDSTPAPTNTQAPAAAAAALSLTETPLPQPTQTAVSPPTLPPAAAANQPEVINAVQAAVEPVKAAPSGSAADWLLPIAGLLLAAGGATAFVARRKKIKDQ